MKGAWDPASLAFVSALLVLPCLFLGPASAQGRANLPPVAIISDPPDGAVFWVNQTIYFNGTSSYDPDGRITDWLWTFAGYGYEFNRSQIGVDWNFSLPGSYLVVLIVHDDAGGQGVAAITVTITGPESPIANIAYPYDSSHVGVNRSVLFSSEGSQDITWQELTYFWDFGDGTNSTAADPVHKYEMTGVYMVNLWVRTETGGEGHDSMGLYVTDGSDTGPLAVISSPANGAVIGVGEGVHFSSNGSMDLRGYQLSYLWNFGDYGPWAPYQDPANVTHSFSEPGTYCVTLLVISPLGLYGIDIGEDRIQLTVLDTNKPPVAVISGSLPSNCPPGTTVQLDAGGSYDPDGDNLTFDWWLNGTNGTPGSRHLSGRQTYLTLNERGSFELTLIVSDAKGKSALARKQLAVMDMDRLLIWPLNGSQFETGRLVEFTGQEAFPPQGAPPLMYCWSFGDGATAEGQAVQHAYSRAGNYTINLRAWRDNETFERIGWLLVIDGGGTTPVAILFNGLNETHNVFKTGSSINFSLRGSLWPSQAGARHQWDFGDGNRSEGPSVTHVYVRSGDYDVSMTESRGNQSITLHRTLSIRSTTIIRLGPALPGWVQFLLISISIVVVAGVALFLGGTEIGIFALFSFLIFLYTRIKQEEILDNYTRGQIKGYITANPGDHYNSIKQALDLNNGTLAYHLKRLENEGIIKSRADGIYKRFYPYEMRVPEPDGKALTEMQKLILDRVGETPGIAQKDIAGFLRVSSGTINYHMETLIKLGRVVRKRDGMKVRYYLMETSFTDVVEGMAK